MQTQAPCAQEEIAEDARSVSIKNTMSTAFNEKYNEIINFILSLPVDQTMKQYAMKSLDECGFWITRGILAANFNFPKKTQEATPQPISSTDPVEGAEQAPVMNAEEVKQ